MKATLLKVPVNGLSHHMSQDNIDFGRFLDSDTNNVVPKQLLPSVKKLKWLIILPRLSTKYSESDG
jgi:hypothetical protein